MGYNEIESANRNHLETFKKCLENKGLSKKTISNHVSNIDFYINDFICYYFEEDVTYGCYGIDRFLGDWFIRKAMWSSCAHIKANAASIKKFYACMLENGVVTKDDYETLCETIKDCMSDWLEEMERYENDIDLY